MSRPELLLAARGMERTRLGRSTLLHVTTGLMGYSDTLGTRAKRHCKQLSL